MLFALPFSKSAAEITIVTAAVSIFAKKMIVKEPLLKGSGAAEILLFLFLAAQLPSFLNSGYLGLSARALFSKSLKFAMLFLAASQIIDTKDKLRGLMFVAAVSAIMITADGFIQQFITHRDLLHNYPAFYYRPEVAGPTFPTASFPYPNDYAAWILVFIFPAAAFAVFGDLAPASRLGVSGIFAALAYSLMLTKVRGAWLGFVSGLSVLGLFRMKAIAVILIAVFLAGAVFVNRNLVAEMRAITSIRDRSGMWDIGWQIFRKHPVIGSGLNTFYMEYARARTDEYRNLKGSYAHNCYLQMAAEVGVVGLVPFLAFCSTIIAKGVSVGRRTKDGLYYPFIAGATAGLLAFLVHSFVDTNLYSLNLAALFWLVSGALVAAARLSEKAGQ